jgi:hypothetical protein
MRIHERVLKFVCLKLECPLPPSANPRKIDWVNMLCDWVSIPQKLICIPLTSIVYLQCAKQSEVHSGDVETLARLGDVLTAEEMEEIRSDIRSLMTPSWMTSVPATLGSSGHGKLKADQWCVWGTTYLPISLICLWGKVEAGNDRSERCHKILHVTISLLSAIIIASSRVTSHSCANLYLQHIQVYISGIK